MDEHESAPAEWNPLAKIEDVMIPLDVSGGRAAIVCRKWSGRERLAYEDAITERLMTTDQNDESTIRLGTLRLFAASMIVVGSTGFPLRDGRTMFTGTREQREDDLLALDPATFDEVRRHAFTVQPLPSMEEADEDKGTDDAADPSPTPSTRPNGADAAPPA